eukprot:GEMP01033467.1.p1 GENE.GEMP01033467.1~~GEMP01033467.1.p1  ORF type:complete len:385 (+),score=90.31 GEMP01033467.1:83-1237(+)
MAQPASHGADVQPFSPVSDTSAKPIDAFSPGGQPSAGRDSNIAGGLRSTESAVGSNLRPTPSFGASAFNNTGSRSSAAPFSTHQQYDTAASSSAAPAFSPSPITHTTPRDSTMHADLRIQQIFGGRPTGMPAISVTAPATGTPSALPYRGASTSAAMGISWRLWKQNAFDRGAPLEKLARTRAAGLDKTLILEKAPIKQKSSLPLQLFLRFETRLFAPVFAVWTLAATIFKNAALPASPTPAVYRGTEEVILLILYIVVQPPRLLLGSRGNRCEDGKAIAMFIFFSFATLFIHGYFFTVQVYVLKFDFILNFSAIVIQSTCVIVSVVTIMSLGIRNREFGAVLCGVALCFFTLLFVLLHSWGRTYETASCPFDPKRQCGVTRTT